MGEAVYYCKIFFEDEDAAIAALPKIRKFFKQGIEAGDYWQSNRGESMRAMQFWAGVDQRFPIVSKYLKYAKVHGGDKNNALAGMLDFGSLDDLDQMEVVKSDKEPWIQYSAMVWHFAHWDALLHYATEQYGATRYSWVSDEYADMFELCT